MEKGDKYALVIGIENYPKSSGMKRAGYAVNDAKAMAIYARKAGYTLVFKKPLLDREATHQKILNGIDLLFDYAKKREDSVFLYCAGHGVYTMEGFGYLIPYDFNLKSCDLYNEGNAILFNSIAIRYNKIKNDEFIFLLDTCHSGFATDSGFEIHSRGLGYNRGELKKFLGMLQEMIDEEDKNRIVKRLIFASSGSFKGSSWRKDYKHGLFTYFLLEALTSQNENGACYIEADRLIDTVQRNVKDYCVSQEKPTQEPVHQKKITGSFLIPTFSGIPIKESIHDTHPEMEYFKKEKKSMKSLDWNVLYNITNQSTTLSYFAVGAYATVDVIKHYMDIGGPANIIGVVIWGLITLLILLIAGRWGQEKVVFSGKNGTIGEIIKLESAKLVFTFSMPAAGYMIMIKSPNIFFSPYSFGIGAAIFLSMRAFSKMKSVLEEGEQTYQEMEVKDHDKE